jgi:hypothetical protein
MMSSKILLVLVTMMHHVKCLLDFIKIEQTVH